MKLCDLTLAEYLALTQGWSTAVWIITTLAIVAGAWIWKRWKKARAAAVPIAIEPAAFVPPERCCPVCGGAASPDLVAFARRNVYVRGGWEDGL